MSGPTKGNRIAWAPVQSPPRQPLDFRFISQLLPMAVLCLGIVEHPVPSPAYETTTPTPKTQTIGTSIEVDPHPLPLRCRTRWRSRCHQRPAATVVLRRQPLDPLESVEKRKTFARSRNHLIDDTVNDSVSGDQRRVPFSFEMIELDSRHGGCEPGFGPRRCSHRRVALAGQQGPVYEEQPEPRAPPAARQRPSSTTHNGNSATPSTCNRRANSSS